MCYCQQRLALFFLQGDLIVWVETKYLKNGKAIIKQDKENDKVCIRRKPDLVWRVGKVLLSKWHYI